jgi:hypothetical protein
MRDFDLEQRERQARGASSQPEQEQQVVADFVRRLDAIVEESPKLARLKAEAVQGIREARRLAHVKDGRITYRQPGSVPWCVWRARRGHAIPMVLHRPRRRVPRAGGRRLRTARRARSPGRRSGDDPHHAHYLDSLRRRPLLVSSMAARPADLGHSPRGATASSAYSHVDDLLTHGELLSCLHLRGAVIRATVRPLDLGDGSPKETLRALGEALR